VGYTVIKLDREPIILVRVFGSLTTCEQTNLLLNVAGLTDQIAGKVYRVVDATGRQASFAETVERTSLEMKGWAGTASDPRVITFAAIDGANTLIAARILLRAFPEQKKMFIFNTLAEALAGAREMIATEARNGAGVTTM